MMAPTPMMVTATFSGELLSTALATGSYGACEFAIELQSRK
jgi:hypothetical protein